MDFDVHAKMVTLVEKCGLFDEVEMRLPKALEIAPKQGLLVSDHSTCKLLEITPNRVFEGRNEDGQRTPPFMRKHIPYEKSDQLN